MNNEDYLMQSLMPIGFKYLGNKQLFDMSNKPISGPKYYAYSDNFNNQKPFYANDKNKLMSLCWRATHLRMKSIPSDYLKNGCGTDK